MELMLKACEEYALENNLDPKKSKSKCIYMHGSLKKGQLPLNLKLYNVDLPWVKTATHLGNEMCENRDFVLNSGKL